MTVAGATIGEIGAGFLLLVGVTPDDTAAEAELLARKVANLERTRPDVISTGNIGCMNQIQGGTAIPVVHTASLLDWATGGPVPSALAGRTAARAA